MEEKRGSNMQEKEAKYKEKERDRSRGNVSRKTSYYTTHDNLTANYFTLDIWNHVVLYRSR